MRRSCAIWLLTAASLFLASCSGVGSHSSSQSGSGSGGSTSPTLTALSVTPNTATANISSNISFKAAGAYSDGSTKDLTASVQWSSSSSTVASITSAGVATGLAAGTTTISAQSGSIKGAATLTVLTSGGGGGSGGSGGGGGSAPTLTAVTLSPANPTLPVNTALSLTATGSYSDGSSADITLLVSWSSSSSSIATVDNTGTVTGLAAGTSSITATLSGVSQSTTVTVAAPTISSISISPGDLTLPIGIAQPYIATATYSDGSSGDLTSSVTWTSSATAVASITNNGVATTVGAGSTTVTATVGSLTDSVTLTVVGAHLVSIAVSPATATMPVGTTQQFTATGSFDDGSTQVLSPVQWSSNASSVLTVDSAGLATAAGAGSATLTATAGSISGTASITVTNVTLVSLAIAPTNSTMPVGATKQFTATGSYSDGSSHDMTGSVLWRSSTATVAVIDAGGLVSSLATGSSTISASSGSVTQSTTLTVSTVDLVSIAIIPSNPTVEKGTSLKLIAIGTYSDGSTAALTSVSWKSSKNNIANMRGSGTVHAKKTGTATITASAFGIKGNTTLTVGSGTLSSVQIMPANPTVSAGATQQFAAVGTFSDGSTQDVTLNSHWSSSSASVATIANAPVQAGLATTFAPGVATIGVNSGGITASTSLTVK